MDTLGAVSIWENTRIVGKSKRSKEDRWKFIVFKCSPVESFFFFKRTTRFLDIQMNILDIVQEAEKILNRRIFYLWIESEIKHASEMRNQRSESSSTPHSLLPSWFFSTTTIHQWKNVGQTLCTTFIPKTGNKKRGRREVTVWKKRRRRKEKRWKRISFCCSSREHNRGKEEGRGRRKGRRPDGSNGRSGFSFSRVRILNDSHEGSTIGRN